MDRRARAWAFAAALLAATGAAARGDPPCVLDKCLGQPPGSDLRATPPGAGETRVPADPGFRGPVAPGAFDFYVLALSWSPGFCETGGAEKARRQCAPGAGLGFVVHGLWPQNTQGYPSDCNPGGPGPSRPALDAVRGLYPDEGLARHEWRKHGTCTGLSPAAYFADVNRARAAVTIPDPFRAPSAAQQWSPADIARAFAAANPRLRPDGMAVTCRRDSLEEVRICFTKDLRGFVACPEVTQASCRRPVSVPPVM